MTTQWIPASFSEFPLNVFPDLESFKYFVVVIVLIITIVSALLPLWISTNGPSVARVIMVKKLPFVTAGVFIGSGLLHLLPSSVKMYSNLMSLSPETFSAEWTREFPAMYFLSAIGCMIVWSVDLLNLGDSGKMMAVASAAHPNRETSMCRVQIPTVASYGERRRSISLETLDRMERIMTTNGKGGCSCGKVPPSPANALFHKTEKTEETTLLLLHDRMKMLGSTTVNSYVYDHPHHHMVDASHGSCPNDEDIAMEPEATISEHVVFTGQSSLLPYLLAILFSVHSLIAGFALGVNRSSSKTAVATTIAILSHKVIEAMSVGSNFARAKSSIGHNRAIAVLTIYSFMTPLGVVVGLWLSEALQGTAALVAESVALSIASGSFVYLSFHEMSDEHACQGASPVQKIVLFGCGLLSMAALAIWV